MVRVEVTLENSFEIHNIPGIGGLAWTDMNIIALQIVYDNLKHRAIHDDLNLDGLQLCARNPEWKPEWNDDVDWISLECSPHAERTT